MRIKDNGNDFGMDDEMNAITALQGCMGYIFETCIDKADLTQEEAEHLGLIGLTLQVIGEKAYAFEQIQKGEQNENSLN